MMMTIRRLSTLLLWRRTGWLANTLWVLALAVMVGIGLTAMVYWSIQGEHALLPRVMVATLLVLMLMPFIMVIISVGLTAHHTSTPHYELIVLSKVSNMQLVYGFFVGIVQRVQIYLALSLAIVPALGLSIGYLIDRDDREYTVFRQGSGTVQTLLYEPIDWEIVLLLSVGAVTLLVIYWVYNWFAIALGVWIGLRWRGMLGRAVAPAAVLIGMFSTNCVCMAFVIVPLPFILITTSSRSEIPIIVAIVGGLGIVPFLLTGIALSIAEPHARRQME